MLTYIIKYYIYLNMKKLFTTLFILFTLPLFSQVVERYEAYDVDTLTVYYTKVDTVKNVILEEGTFVKGFKSGLWTSFYPNGKIEAVAYYKEGIKNGSWRTYDSKGRLITKVKYKKGRMVSAVQARYY